MTKRDLVVQIARDTGLTQQDVLKVIQMTLDSVTDALARGGHVELRDFGVFEVCERKARVGRNPNKPAIPVPIPAHKVVRFKPGRLMKARVAKL